ncbi:hypothetical protein ACSLN8_27400, partial [Escherichia coli]
ELALSLFGITRADSGDIYLEGKPVTIKDNTHAVKLGIAYVSEPRPGVVLEIHLQIALFCIIFLVQELLYLQRYLVVFSGGL